MREIIRTTEGWGLVTDGGTPTRLRHSLAEMLAGAPLATDDGALDGVLLAPVDVQEVWAAGVTYQRSRDARVEESDSPDFYQRVYDADRPELFLKATPGRVLGNGATALLRRDSGWDVPEPEVGLVLDHSGALFGYTIGDDLSSRSIEGENPLYLPQAKIWDGSCIVGPSIVLAQDAEAPFDINLTITRDGAIAAKALTSTSKMARTFEDLASWLFRHLSFPHGVILLTGTGVVPDDDFTLLPGDQVSIEVSGLGTLTHGIAYCS